MSPTGDNISREGVRCRANDDESNGGSTDATSLTSNLKFQWQFTIRASWRTETHISDTGMLH
jgi:hypothetical protein